jgi:type 1 glutamine amidotransferase
MRAQVLYWAVSVALLAVASPRQQGDNSIIRSKSTGLVLLVADDQSPMHALVEALTPRGRFEYRIVTPSEIPPVLAGYHAVFMYIHGPMDHAIEDVLIEYARQGGRLIILHHGIASARRNNPDWLDLTGIRMLSADAPAGAWRVIHNTTHTVVNLAPGHFITTHNVSYDRQVAYLSSDQPSVEATFPAFDLPDTEVFLNQHFCDGRTKTVLFGFRCTDPQTGRTFMQDRSGWLKPAGAGWVFYYQPGHKSQDFQHPAYLQVLFNTLIWAGLGAG